ncbi:MAG: DUF1707 domain-containing protein [Rhodococcus sp.]|uniref:DUF1707 SHOCT-like domain-containing protein n=1 Tax=Rhodococcus TaxID=1827 RepID=UPI0016BA3CBB|nr:DUF1707 domain-containing protein [Rhodococcus sp. (in: high G+C Gram-positive bacteria)]NLV80893.1 DUF1707 domain-containing protein [Rhodococcus sp. (in: high G+C Gram-positive bacteria)]
MADSPDIRIGDRERAQALDLLSQHFGLGRLSVSEFDERSARASVATTRGELDTLFTDLPAHTANVPDTAPDTPTRSPALERWREITMGLTPLIALVLFFVFDSWLWFLLVPAVSLVLYAGRDDAPEKNEKNR